jgi:hypothetical protein
MGDDLLMPCVGWIECPPIPCNDRMCVNQAITSNNVKYFDILP